MDMKHLELVTEIARVVHETQRAYDKAIGREPAKSWRECDAGQRAAAQLVVITCLQAGDQEAPHSDLDRSEPERIRDAITQGVVNAIYQR
jgi:hypothetical protein